MSDRRCACDACGLGFLGVSAFEAHRIGDYAAPCSRRCLSVAELEARGWRQMAAGWTSAPTLTDGMRARLEGARSALRRRVSGVTS